ncbi:MAG: hypothetical protein ACJ74Z_21255 [Bryobacteraceae bacterium]
MRIRASLCTAAVLSTLTWSAHSAQAEWIEAGSESRALASTRSESNAGGSNPTNAPQKLTISGPESLAQVRLANELLYSDLQNFVCDETIERYKGALGGVEGRRIDTVLTQVSFENGIEHYTNIRRNSKSLLGIASLSGAWSEGEYGTLLRQTQALLGSHVVLLRAKTQLNGVATALYRFEVSEQESPWDLEVEASHYHVPFRTDVWVSLSSGQILKIERTSTAIPLETRISEVRWSVSLHTVELNGNTWLLPNTGEYEVIYEESHRREWNLMTFSDYHRYGSEVALQFESK